MVRYRGRVTIDGETRYVAFPASKSEAYVVRGYHVGNLLEATLTRDTTHHHVFNEDTQEPVELFALQRFHRGEGAEYSHFLGNLETAARLLARGDHGYKIHTSAEDGNVILSMTARLLQPDGLIHTEICHEQTFTDPDSSLALVQANEKATELRAQARTLNEAWVEQRDARLAQIRAAYDRDDEKEAAAEELHELVDTEALDDD